MGLIDSTEILLIQNFVELGSTIVTLTIIIMIIIIRKQRKKGTAL